MKRILISTFVLLSFIANSQTSIYKPFPTSFGNWIYRYHDDFGFPTAQVTQYTINGDTIIASLNYKKIFVNTIYKGALRENSKIIYFVPDTANSEYLLYNFNLLTGDSIIHPFGEAWCTNDTLTVASIDSILLSDGYHKQYHFDPVGPDWVEGVGSFCYLLQPLQVLCVSGNDLLECMQSDNNFNYPASSSSCVLSLADEQNIFNTITIVPNPFHESTIVNFNNTDIKEIFISDLQGKIILQRKINKQAQIKIANIGTGMFILKAVDINHRTLISKLISCP